MSTSRIRIHISDPAHGHPEYAPLMSCAARPQVEGWMLFLDVAHHHLPLPSRS